MSENANRTETEKLLVGLKQLFREAGLTYGDVALQLGTSVNSIKRYMGGKGLTMSTFERLCSLVGFTISELADLCRDKGIIGLKNITIEQEDVLGRDPRLSLIFLLLAQGWKPEEIASEFNMSEAVLLQYLTRLDRYEFLMLLPGNRVKLKVVATWDSVRSGLLTKTMRAMWKQAFPGIDCPSDNEPWQFGFTRLAPQSLEKIRRKFNSFTREFYTLIEDDRHLPADQVSWYTISLICWEGLLMDNLWHLKQPWMKFDEAD